MLKTITGFASTTEAAKMMAAIENRANGALLFQAVITAPQQALRVPAL